MANPLETLFNRFRRRRVRPTETVGRSGTAIYGGYVVENEKKGALTDRERYRTFSDILVNTSIVAAGVRYFLNLCAKAGWTFQPSDEDTDGKFAELAEAIVTDDPDTSWSRIVRRAAMYRFYGFSVQEWTARRRKDGVMTFADIAPRAQITIERWDVDDDGTVRGILQRNPQNQDEIYLPREKVVYMVDDTLNDSPQGLGLFRHLAEPADRLKRYEQLEGFGFETDLRGIPVGRVPYARLRQAVKANQITEQDALDAVSAIETFITQHIKHPALGLLIDSAVYETIDAAARPSSSPQFDMSLLTGSQTSLPDMAKSIERLNRELARILGVEAILLGDGDRGSMALSKDKTNQFSLTVDSTLGECADGFEKDLLRPTWQMNGWPEEMMPSMVPEAVHYRDVEQIAGALRDIADAGAPLAPDDPAVEVVRALVGLPAPESVVLQDAANMRTDDAPEGEPDDPEDDMPENPNRGGDA